MFKIDPAENSMKLIRGDSAEFDIGVYIGEGEQEQEYTLQEGDVLSFTVKEDTETEEALLQKTGTHVSILPEDTADWNYGEYVYDVELKFANGTTDTIIEPTTFSVLEEVTF